MSRIGGFDILSSTVVQLTSQVVYPPDPNYLYTALPKGTLTRREAIKKLQAEPEQTENMTTAELPGKSLVLFLLTGSAVSFVGFD